MDVPTEGSGSGSVLDKEGHVLTNFHVIEGAQQVRVTLANGNSYAAGLVGQDPSNDIAVLKIEAPSEELHPITWGDSTDLQVGQKIYRDRQSVRTGTDADGGNHLQPEPHVDVAEPAHDQEHHPDRRRPESGQFGRPAAGQPESLHRHEYGHRQHDRREYGGRFRHPGQYHQTRGARS